MTKNAIATTEKNIPKNVLFASSTGLTIAIPAQTIAAPAIGEAERPSEPAIAAAIPSLSYSNPRAAAFVVTASLNANVAASPEPVTIPMINGTNVPPNLT